MLMPVTRGQTEELRTLLQHNYWLPVTLLQPALHHAPRPGLSGGRPAPPRPAHSRPGGQVHHRGGQGVQQQTEHRGVQPHVRYNISW